MYVHYVLYFGVCLCTGGEDDEDSGDFVTDRHKHKQSLAGEC